MLTKGQKVKFTATNNIWNILGARGEDYIVRDTSDNTRCFQDKEWLNHMIRTKKAIIC